MGKVKCKKTLLSNNIEHFIKGNSYEVIDENNLQCKLMGENAIKFIFFTQSIFLNIPVPSENKYCDYFYTIKELREEKIKKLINEIN